MSKGTQGIHFVVGKLLDREMEKYFNFNFYALERNQAVKFATSINREVAEGPAELIEENYPYGAVCLWPLCTLEVSSDFSGTAIPTIRGR